MGTTVVRIRILIGATVVRIASARFIGGESRQVRIDLVKYQREVDYNFHTDRIAYTTPATTAIIIGHHESNIASGFGIPGGRPGNCG